MTKFSDCIECGSRFQRKPKSTRKTCGASCERLVRKRNAAAAARSAGDKIRENGLTEAQKRNLIKAREANTRRLDTRRKAKRKERAAMVCRVCKNKGETMRGVCSKCSSMSYSWRRWRRYTRGRVISCVVCGIEFCNLYTVISNICSDECRAKSKTRARRKTGGRHQKRARRYGCLHRPVHTRRVFARDGYQCQICGIDTPLSKRGTTDHDAPELDHVWPLSRGGHHSEDNTQCLCRDCNSLKGDKTMQEFHQWATQG